MFVGDFARRPLLNYRVVARIPSLDALANRSLGGVPWMLLAMLAFASHDALAKRMLETWPVAQLLLIGSAAGFAAITPRLHRRGWRRVFVVERPALHLLRALLIVAEMVIFYAAVRLLPLAECLTIYQAMPLFAAALAVLLLGEKVNGWCWTAIVAGFLGVVLVMRPGLEGIAWPALLALLGTLIYAAANVLTRALHAAGDDTLIAWQTAAAVIACAIAAPFVWMPIGWGSFVLACLLGIITTVGNLFFNRALVLSPAAVVLPFHYSIIVWGLVFGWLVWRDVPDLQMLLGAAIIVASGIILMTHHRQT